MRRSTSADPAPRRLLAPLWHTAGLVGILLATLPLGAWLQRGAASGPGPGLPRAHRGVLEIYGIAIVLDWALFYYVRASTSRSGTTLAELVGGRWTRAADVLRDLAITLPFSIVWEATALGIHRLLGPTRPKPWRCCSRSRASRSPPG